MRLMLKIRASLKPAGAVALALCVFASGRVVFASEQQAGSQVVTQPPAAKAAEPTGPQLQLTADEAVRLALDNNLGVRAERLGPQIGTYGVAQARAAFAPSLFSSSTKRNSTTPPDILASGGLGSTSTSNRIQTNVGVRQAVPWGGGNYSVSVDASRASTNTISSFNPQLGSNLFASYTQPLLRGFTIDPLRAQVLQSKKTEEIADLQLREELTSIERRVRDAYYTLIGAMGRLEVARQSLALARESERQNRLRVEVGVMARIDIIEAEAEVARVEESVLIAEANIKTFEDNLRTLVLNPAQPDFWTVRLIPTEQPVLTAQAVDVEAAITAALQNRTDLLAARKRLESTDIGIDLAKNSKLPAVDLVANYNTVGIAGTAIEYAQGFPPEEIGRSQRAFGEALRDVFGSNFKTWSVRLDISYPLGTSQAEASLASGRLQREQQVTGLRELEVGITAQIRDAARAITNSLQRVDATRKAREFAQIRYEAEQKRITAGLSTTFQLLNAQQALSNARLQENSAIIDYNRALVAFHALQTSPR
jgi:outer membrane protein TolC